jgi:hypothetical protein
VTDLNPATSFIIGSLSPGTIYTFAVAAGDAAGNQSSWSSQVTATTQTSGGNDGSTSTTLQTGNPVIVTAAGHKLAVRASPGGSLLRQVDAGAKGTIDCSQAGGIACPTIQNGLVWWYVNYQSGSDGWSAEKFVNLAKGDEIYLRHDTGTTIADHQCPQSEIHSATLKIQEASQLILACLSNLNACTPQMKFNASAKLSEAAAILAACQI